MRKALFLLLVIGAVVGCDGGGTGDKGGSFRLIQFLEDNQANIARNHEITFLFSEPVKPGQDFAQRLKIQSVETSPVPDFTLAIGVYILSGDRVTFKPRLPNLADRGDAGFRSDTNYVVFLKGGPDALESMTGQRVANPQQFSFVTNQFFEDYVPTEPPRALGFVARDPISDQTTDLSRLDPRPAEEALLDSAALIAGGRFVDPGAGGAPTFGTPWQFEMLVSEPIDPLTASTNNVEMFEIASDATTSAPDAAPAAPPGHTGNPVQFRVPLNVRMQQGLNVQGDVEVRIIVTPVYTLVDDTRYRITFSGSVLGLDFRKEFTGANGLTGDGQTVLSGSPPYAEPGGLGYTTDFIVADRSAITQTRTLTYDPLVDNIQPELGQTVADKARYNSALYNPAISPGTAVGFLSAFGQGTDGNLAVSSGTVTVDTGDTANAPSSTFQTFDLNPTDSYHTNTLPGGPITYNNPKPFELQLQSLAVSSGAALKFIGKNPPILRVRGIAQVAGLIDISGGDGVAGGGTIANGGVAGAAGFAGGATRRPGTCVGYCPGGANDFSVYLNACAAANANQPHSFNGTGPGRGYAGGTGYSYDYVNDLTQGGGTGGGGASHASAGNVGEDLKNAGGGTGTGGLPCDTTCGIRNDGVIGVRGQSGPLYGDREAAVILLGGSGGGGGGAAWPTGTRPRPRPGGSGGGGGGSVTIIAAGAILLNGGTIDASGGNGGKGMIVVQSAANAWQSTSGGGGAAPAASSRSSAATRSTPRARFSTRAAAPAAPGAATARASTAPCATRAASAAGGSSS